MRFRGARKSARSVGAGNVGVEIVLGVVVVLLGGKRATFLGLFDLGVSTDEMLRRTLWDTCRGHGHGLTQGACLERVEGATFAAFRSPDNP